MHPSFNPGNDSCGNFSIIGKKTVMVMLVLVSILLVLNMLFTYPERIGMVYGWVYRKLKNPKFAVGEFVLINGLEFEVIYVSREQRPYTYLCVPVNPRSKQFSHNYYHESEIKKKTGLLKELE